jgi:hypothetical protein
MIKNRDGVGYPFRGKAKCAECHCVLVHEPCVCPPDCWCITCGNLRFLILCRNPNCSTHQVFSIAINEEHAEAELEAKLA